MSAFNQSRKNIVVFVFVLMFIVIIAQLAHLQLFSSDLRLQADAQGTFRKVIYPDRGIIYDRHKKSILQNTIIYDLMVTPNKLKGVDTVALCKILNIDTRNLQATVEPGVINYIFQEEVKKLNLFYPPDPASWGSCSLGGNIAHSSGGPKAVKYGTTRDYVLNLEVVLASGEIIWTGANTLKYSTGYNLTHLFIGSEGTLGVVTKIVFKLIPLPKNLDNW